MTTIAYRSGVIAADTRSYIGDTITSHRAQKLLRLKDGRLVGWAGNMTQGAELARWIEDPKGDRPKIDLSLIEVKTDGTCRMHDNHGEVLRLADDEFMAVGSGAAAALAAMHMGADARKAIRIAMLVDPWSGGNVQSLELEPRADFVELAGPSSFAAVQADWLVPAAGF